VLQVVQRKNGDSQKRDLEVNKSIADVMIARSDGTSRYVLMHYGDRLRVGWLNGFPFITSTGA